RAGYAEEDAHRALLRALGDREEDCELVERRRTERRELRHDRVPEFGRIADIRLQRRRVLLRSLGAEIRRAEIAAAGPEIRVTRRAARDGERLRTRNRG